MTTKPNTHVTAAPQGSEAYTYFKLKNRKLTISRRGKESVFKIGDPLGWRMSSSGNSIRLISPLTGPNIIFSLDLTDDVLKWLDRQDPNSKRKIGQRKSDKPEDGGNVLEGYAVTDGTWFYKMEPKPVRSKKKEEKILYAREERAKRFATKFPERKLKVIPVYTKDVGQEARLIVSSSGPKYPDTKEGVIQMLKNDASPSLVKDLNLATAVIEPDNAAEGTWSVDSMKTGDRVVVYLSGYKDPQGRVREYDDFEAAGIPESDMKRYVESGKMDQKVLDSCY